MKRYKLAIDFDCRDMEAVARPAADGEYVLATEAQAQIDLLRTALEEIAATPSVPFTRDPQLMASRTIDRMQEIANAALDQTKP